MDKPYIYSNKVKQMLYSLMEDATDEQKEILNTAIEQLDEIKPAEVVQLSKVEDGVAELEALKEKINTISDITQWAINYFTGKFKV